MKYDILVLFINNKYIFNQELFLYFIHSSSFTNQNEHVHQT
jgi:hypothetical protein